MQKLWVTIVVALALAIGAQTGTQAQSFTCSQDPLEPNDMDTQAYLIGALQVSFAQTLFICPTSDEDWFAKDLKQGDQFSVEVDTRPFNVGFTTLQVCILDTNAFTELACNARQAQRESMQYTVQADGRYYVRVAGFDTGTNEFEYDIGIVTQSKPEPSPVLPPSISTPIITGLSPTKGSAGTEVTVLGGGFVRWTLTDSTESVVIFEGKAVSTTYVDGFTLKFTVPSSVSCPGFASVKVQNTIPNTLFPPLSNEKTFDVVCPATGPQDQVDIELVDVEVVQSVQSLDHDIPLVAGKPTVARLYVKTHGKSVPVEARLFAKVNGAEVPWITNPRATGYTCYDRLMAQSSPKLSDQRDDTSLSIECEVPTVWLETPNPRGKSNSLELTAEVYLAANTSGGFGRRSTTVTDPNEGNNRKTVKVAVEASPPINVRVIQLRSGGSGPAYQDYRLILKMAEEMFPLSQIELSPHRLWAHWWGDAGSILSLFFVSTWASFDSLAPNVVTLGMVRDSVVTSGLCGMGSPGFAWVTVSNGNLMEQGCAAHELGHALSSMHVEACKEPWPWEKWPFGDYPFAGGNLSNGTDRGDYWGVSVSASGGVQRVYPPLGSKDLMTYCSNPKWISAYSYGKFRAVLRGGVRLPYKSAWPVESEPLQLQLGASPFGPALAQRLAPNEFDRDGEYLLVIGSLDPQTQAASLFPMMQVRGSDLSPNAPLSEPGPYAVKLLDADGSVLGSQSFGLPDGPHQENGRPFAVVLPAAAGVAQVVVEGEAGALSSFPVSANAPTISGVDARFDETSVVSWDATDPDGDPLRAFVFFSADGGDRWEPVVVGLDGNQAELDTAFWPGTSQGMLRVLVSDGYHTAQSVFGPFEVSSKAPDVFIVGPEDGAQLGVDAELGLGAGRFAAQGFDAEDGPLSGDSLSWSSSADGLLGQGESITAALTPGRHTISVTARDHDGNASVASVQVFVSEAGDEGSFGDVPSPAPDGVAAALDANRNNFLDDGEIHEAIRLWISGASVPGTSQIISDAQMKELIQLWVTGATLSSASAERLGQGLQPLQVDSISLSGRGDDLTLHVRGQGVASIQLQVFDLTGKRLLERNATGQQLRFAPADAGERRWANGVYLYLVTARGLDGTLWRSPVRKFAVLH